MNFEVVVVGGGIGGLTTAALLAARGVNVCLLERQSRVGGCVANFEHSGFQFEPTHGLYSGWEPGGIHEQIFSELSVEAPRIQRLSPAYMVRLPDGTDVPISENREDFASHLRAAFPECFESAVDFYRQLAQERGEPGTVSGDASLSAHLQHCSLRFRRFIDIQLQTFAQCSSDDCRYELAAMVLNPQRGRWEIEGGAQTLADALAESLRRSGGTLRLNSPVLRLAYGLDSLPIGVDLLNGEQVVASHAIISNLTSWDTYGKLIGLNHTPSAISTATRKARSWGAYLLFLGMDRNAAARLPSRRVLGLTDWQDNQTYDPEVAQFVFAAASDSDPRAPDNKLAVTVSAFTNAEDWFAFHEDHSEHDEQDQRMLEAIWSQLHSAMPELGDSVEVIESATPQTLYDTTRRKFGMVGRPRTSVEAPNPAKAPFATTLPNVFLVGDTVAPAPGIAGISELAFALANTLAVRFRP
jgi:phytoene dehydrogenase-like protein